MEKLVYLFWKDGAEPAAVFRTRLLADVAPRLGAAGARGITVNVADVFADLDGSVPTRNAEATLAASVSFWLPCLDDRTRLAPVLADAAARHAAYLVTESIPRDYDRRDWPAGARTPGVKLLTVFEQPARLDDTEFFARWHGSHTPLSMAIHPMWRYVRNGVARALTEGAPPYKGIVEEQFRTEEDLTDPMRFYKGEGSKEQLATNMQRILEDASSFLDLDRTTSVVMSEYLLAD